MAALDPDKPVHLLLGEEVLLVQRAEEALIQAALPEGRSGFTFSAYQASEGASDAMSVARTMPMMARRRVVLIRELEQASSDLLQQIIDYLASPSPSTLLVLVGQKLPAAEGGKSLGSRLSNAVKKLGEVSRFSARDVRPDQFVADLLRGAGSQMDASSMRLLLEMVGGDLGRLQSETDKLICYVGAGKTITPEAVAAVCSLVAEAQIWDLTDALVRRNPDRALAAMHRLLEDGKASHQLLAMVSWQFRQLLELQAAERQGGGLPQSWSRMPRQ